MAGIPDLSLVVPVKNEADNIVPLYEAVCSALDGASPRFELIFVDDGSTDQSLERLQALGRRDQRVVWLSLDGPHGQTAAWDAGFHVAQGRLIATMDGDLQNDPADLPAMMARIGPDCDVVCGVRQKRQDPALRRLQSWIGNGFRNWVTGESVTDVGCSLRVFRRECLAGLTLYDGLHRFFPTLLKLEGYRICETPVRHHPRRRGVTKYGVWNRVFKGMRDCLAVRWMARRRLRYRVAQRSEPGAPPDGQN